MSKLHLHKNEYEQIREACAEIDKLEISLKTMCANETKLSIILGGVTVTKDRYINARTEILNCHIKQCCNRNNWIFLENSNIQSSNLKDTVHLNRSGEEMYIKNLLSCVQSNGRL